MTWASKLSHSSEQRERKKEREREHVMLKEMLIYCWDRLELSVFPLNPSILKTKVGSTVLPVQCLYASLKQQQ